MTPSVSWRTDSFAADCDCCFSLLLGESGIFCSSPESWHEGRTAESYLREEGDSQAPGALQGRNRGGRGRHHIQENTHCYGCSFCRWRNKWEEEEQSMMDTQEHCI
jgi:hypothetical protein